MAGMHLISKLLAAAPWCFMQEAADKQKAAESAKESKAAPSGPTEEARNSSLIVEHGSVFIACRRTYITALGMQEAAAQEELEYQRLEKAFLEQTSSEAKGQAS